MIKGRTYNLFGHFSFLLLFGFAINYVLERNLYADSAAYIFQIVNTQSFAPQHGRYAAIITQLLPLLAVKLGLPLKVVLMSYSISFILFFYGIWLVITYGLKNHVAGVVLILILFIPIRQNFFKPVTEVHQALTWAVFLFAWLDKRLSVEFRSKSVRIIDFLVAVGIILATYYSHPGSLFFLVFIFGWILMDKKIYKEYPMYGLILFTILLFGQKFFSLSNSSYEGSKVLGISNVLDVFPNIFKHNSFHFVYQNFTELFLIQAIVLVLFIVNVSLLKRFDKLLYVLLFTIIYFIVLILTFRKGDSTIMMEKNFMPLSLIIILPFITDVFRNTSIKVGLKMSFLVIVLLVSTWRIFESGKFYHRRIKYLKGVIEYCHTNGIEKGITSVKNINRNKIRIRWAVPVETILLSSLDDKRKGVTLYTHYEEDRYKDVFNDPAIFLYVPWGINKIAQLNPDYFYIPLNKYQRINHTF